MLKIDLNLVKEYKGVSFSERQLDLINESAKWLSAVVNHPDFDDQVKTFKYRTRRGRVKKGGFRKSNGLTNAGVLAKFKSGDDDFANQLANDSNVAGDRDIDIWLHPYNSGETGYVSKVGFTNKSTYATWINVLKLDAWLDDPRLKRVDQIALVIKNMVHEYCHNLGFQHRGNKVSHFNNGTVPYALGIIAEKVLKELMKEEAEIDVNKIAEVELAFPCENPAGDSLLK